MTSGPRCMMIKAALSLLGLLLLFSPGTVLAQEHHRQAQGAATLTFEAPFKKDRLHLRLSDVLPITVEITLPAGRDVAGPEPLTRSTGWHLWKSTPATVKEAKPGERIWRRQYWLEPLAPGELTLQIESFETQEKGRPAGKETFRWDAVKVQVDTIIKDADVSKARPITSIEDLPPAPPRFSWWPWLALGGVLLFAAGVVLGRWLWRRPAPRPQPTPREWTLGQLDRLVSRKLPERNHIVPFLSLLNLLLRGYLEKTTPVRARRLTSAELIPALGPHLPPEHLSAVEAVLERGDRIRFAGMPSNKEECAALADKVRGFIVAFPPPQPAASSQFSGENNGVGADPSLQRTSTSQSDNQGT